jgi:hypothetical protein
MTAEQQFDMIAEAGWQVCVDMFGQVCNSMPGDGFCLKHHYTDGHDIQRAHYDTPQYTVAVPVRECVRFEGEYVYQNRSD